MSGLFEYEPGARIPDKATSSGILSFIKDFLLLFNISPNPTSLNQSPNLNPTALTTTKPPTAGEPTLL